MNDSTEVELVEVEDEPHPLVDDLIKWAKAPNKWQWQIYAGSWFGWSENEPLHNALLWHEKFGLPIRLVPKENGNDEVPSQGS